jgi:hypothetical protein
VVGVRGICGVAWAVYGHSAVATRVKSLARNEIPTSSDGAPARLKIREASASAHIRPRRIRRQATRTAGQLTASTSTPAFVSESGAAVCYEQRANTVPAMERNRAAFRCGGAREDRGEGHHCKVFLIHKVKLEGVRCVVASTHVSILLVTGSPLSIHVPRFAPGDETHPPHRESSPLHRFISLLSVPRSTPSFETLTARSLYPLAAYIRIKLHRASLNLHPQCKTAGRPTKISRFLPA